jgi:DNA repair protein RadA/Sms
VVGWDSSRLSMVLAVLETRCGVRIGANDIYLNVAGGLKINEPAADLAVAAALISSLTGAPLPADAVYFGEISLAGGVRPVVHGALRLREAEKLGFGSVVTGKLGKADRSSGLDVTEYAQLSDMVSRIAAQGKRPIPEPEPEAW